MIGSISHRMPSGKFRLPRFLRDQAVVARNVLFVAISLLAGSTAYAAGNTLQSIDLANLPGSKAQITLNMSQPARAPLSFTIDNPARIALDFPETVNALKERSTAIGIGVAESMTVVEAKGRTRVVVNLTQMVPYEAHADGNKVVLTIQNAGGELSEAEATAILISGAAKVARVALS